MPSILPRRKYYSLATDLNFIVAGLAGVTGPGTELTTAGNVQSVTKKRSGCNGVKVGSSQAAQMASLRSVR